VSKHEAFYKGKYSFIIQYTVDPRVTTGLTY